MHKLESVPGNETHKILKYSVIQKDYRIPTRRPGLVLINKKKIIYKLVDFAAPTDHRMKMNESKKKKKYLDLA